MNNYKKEVNENNKIIHNLHKQLEIADKDFKQLMKLRKKDKLKNRKYDKNSWVLSRLDNYNQDYFDLKVKIIKLEIRNNKLNIKILKNDKYAIENGYIIELLDALKKNKLQLKVYKLDSYYEKGDK